MSNYIFDWAGEKGHFGKTLRQMWHEERTFVVWCIETKLHLSKPSFYAALKAANVIDAAGKLQGKDKISKELFTKPCGCESRTLSSCCPGWAAHMAANPNLVEVEVDSEEEESEPEIVEEKFNCVDCGEDVDDPAFGVSCWKCNMSKERCEGCQATRCNDCDNFRCRLTCDKCEEGDHCQCGDDDDVDADLEGEVSPRAAKRSRITDYEDDGDEDGEGDEDGDE